MELQLADLNQKKYPTTLIIDSNLLVLYQRLKQVEALWIEFQKRDAPSIVVPSGFVCNSGLRNQAQQNNLIKAGLTTATKSKHLVGCAADISDPEGKIKGWLKDTPAILADAHLWCEHWDYTHGWWHAQTVPPASGNRWFIP